jgi:ATP-dependent DNA ligase
LGESNHTPIDSLILGAPSGPRWVHEIKHDGYRIIVRRIGDRISLQTRNGYNWVGQYPWIANAARELQVQPVVIDGEAVVCGPDGVSDFDKLHSRAHDHRAFLYAFGLLEMDGEDLRTLPLERLKAQLAQLLRGPIPGMVLNEYAEGDGMTIFEEACKLGSKASYQSARTRISSPASPRPGSRSRIRRHRQCSGLKTGRGSPPRARSA